MSARRRPPPPALSTTANPAQSSGEEESEGEEGADENNGIYLDGDQKRLAREINARNSQMNATQKFQMRSQLRETYENISSQIQDEANKQDQAMDNSSVDKVADALTNADLHFNEVEKSGDGKELCTDATVLHTASRILLDRITTLSSRSADKRFDVAVFAEKLKQFVGEGVLEQGDADDDASSLLLDDEGREDEEAAVAEPPHGYRGLRNLELSWLDRSFAAAILKNAPKFDCMLPLIKDTDVNPSDVKPKKDRRAKKDDVEKLVELKNKEKPQHGEGEVSVSKELDTVRKCLKNTFKKANDEPFPYYLFVFDPDSYAKTVENIFYLSFLVKDAQVKLRIVNGLPHLIRIPTEEVQKLRNADKGSLPTNQMIMSFSYGMWQELKGIFNVTSAIIQSKEPRRN